MADPSVSAETLEQRLRKQARGEMLNPLLIEAADALAAQREALESIVALDLGTTPDGRDDFYSGPDRFFRAHAIARKALAAHPRRDDDA